MLGKQRTAISLVFLFFLKFYGRQLRYEVAIVSAVQQSGCSVTHVHTSVLFHILFPRGWSQVPSGQSFHMPLGADANPSLPVHVPPPPPPVPFGNHKSVFKVCWVWSSRRGSRETNLTSIHEDPGLIPGLTQCVRDLVLLWAVVQVTDTAQIWRCCGCGCGVG